MGFFIVVLSKTQLLKFYSVLKEMIGRTSLASYGPLPIIHLGVIVVVGVCNLIGVGIVDKG